MTTNIQVLNRGPRPVKIEIQGRDKDGKFTQGREIVLERGTFSEDIPLYDLQSIQVSEL